MALWHRSHDLDPLMPIHRHPHHLFSLSDHLFDSFDSMFEIPSTWLSEMTRDRPSLAGRTTEITNNDHEFKINLQVEDYKPEELNVKLVRDRFLVVEGKKRERKEKEGNDGFVTGVVSQEFSRAFVVPQGVVTQKLRSNLTKEGVLTIQAPKIAQLAIQHERQIAIEQGEPAAEMDGPQKKKDKGK